MEKWSKNHYNANIPLSKVDIKNGFVRADAYSIYRANNISKHDKSGILFHTLKTILRFGEKNTIDREISAILNQSLRLARDEGVDIRKFLIEELELLNNIYSDEIEIE